MTPEQELQKVIGNFTPTIISQATNNVPDQDLKEAWEKLFDYIKSTCSDKYADPNAMISTKKAVIHGKVKQVNTFNAAKYLARYDTTGYEKSENEKDLFKAIHYLIFEIQRKINNNNNEQTNI